MPLNEEHSLIALTARIRQLQRDNRDLRRALVMLLDEFGSDTDTPDWREPLSVGNAKHLLAKLAQRK